MELDELKNTWTVLDEQLKKNETLNKQIIQEVLRKKSNKSLSRLINTNFVNLCIWLLAIPVSIWGYHYWASFEILLFPKILFVAIGISSIFIVIWSYFPLKNLMKIDFSRNLKDNMYHIHKYAIMLKKEKITVYFGLIPIYYLLGGLCYYEFNANFSLWTFLIVALFISITTTYWMYKRIYETNVQSIKKSLEELKELTEE
jgi:hypothetical protein